MKKGESLFEIWGGVRRMARDLVRPASTVHGWKKEGRIPAAEQPHVLGVSKTLGIAVTAEHVVFPLGQKEASNPSGVSEQGEPVCFNGTSETKRGDE